VTVGDEAISPNLLPDDVSEVPRRPSRPKKRAVCSVGPSRGAKGEEMLARGTNTQNPPFSDNFQKDRHALYLRRGDAPRLHSGFIRLVGWWPMLGACDR